MRLRKKFILICLGLIVCKWIEYVFYCYGNEPFHVNRSQVVNKDFANVGQLHDLRYRDSLQNSNWKSTSLEDKRLGAPMFSNVNVFNDSIRRVRGVNCYKLFRGDTKEIAKTYALLDKEIFPLKRYQISAEEYFNITKDCQTFKTNRGYILSHLTKEEQDFPIAYSIVMYKDVWQFERLLRSIYRPQNFYCIHVDVKCDHGTLRAVQNIAQCFDNVFLASKRFDVKWGNITILKADLSCMQELWNRSTTWKYFINLTGQEFPLRTNYELVKILKAYNGSNDVQGSSSQTKSYRWRWWSAGTPPHGIIPTKGNLHVAVCRAYVDFILHDPRTKAILNWTKRSIIPDELFFSTLNHSPSLNIPGSYKGVTATTNYTKLYMARYVRWYDEQCSGGLIRHGVCILGVEDLQTLFTRKELFANKFYWNYEHFALDCMEELLFNNSRDEYLGIHDFDVSWYSTLEFVKNKLN